MKNTHEYCKGYGDHFNSDGFEEFQITYKIYWQEIYRFFYHKVHNEELAKDLTQDTFIKAMTNNKRIGEDINKKAWLYTIARNVCTDYWRKSSRRSEEDFQMDIIPNPTNSSFDPEFFAQRNETQELVIKVLSKLNESQRQALTLKDVEGNTYMQAAELMNLSVSAYTSLLNRARDNFTQNMVTTLYPRAKNVPLSNVECLSLLKWFNPVDWPENLNYEVTRKARNYFDGMVSNYNQFRRSSYPLDLDKVIQTRLPASQEMIAVDFGSGVGDMATQLSGCFEKVIGVDISPKMVEYGINQMGKKRIRNIELSCGDLNQLSLPNDSIDTGFCVMVLHHLLDPGEAIKEMTRVLKKEGNLLLPILLHIITSES